MTPEFPMKDKHIQEIRRIEGLLAYAVEHGDADEVKRLSAVLEKLTSQED